MASTRIDRSLVASFGAVVLIFVGATWFAHRRAGHIEEVALRIEGNVVPKIRHLATARAELRRLQLTVHRALMATPNAAIEPIEINQARAQLGQDVAAYQRLPSSSSDAGIRGGLQDSLTNLESSLTNLLALARTGDRAAIRQVQTDVDAASEATAQTFSRAIDAKVTEAATLAAEIRRLRQRGWLWAIALDGLGVLLAALAAYLCVQMVRRHARAVDSYRQVAEDRSRELDIFATRMAHDVRNPLAALSLSITALEQARTEDRRILVMRRARSALSQAALIIEGHLEFARAGAHPEFGQSCDLTEIASQVCMAMRPQAEKAGTVLSFDSHSRSTVACSAGVLSSVVGNLVGNALTSVENAPERYVRVTVVDDEREVVASISDTGPGLPSGVDPEELFRPFVRGEVASGGGLGLGLATVKRIVEAHHGQTGVLSGAAGCCFWFRLPRQQQQAFSSTTAATGAGGAISNQLRS